MPVQSSRDPGTRDFGEHLDAVADVLSRSRCTALASRLLVAGTQRRLGVLARAPEVWSALAPFAGPDDRASDLLWRARALWRLETDRR
jgi:hypothetical protein